MNRRSFLRTSASAMAIATLPRFALAAPRAFSPHPNEWREFEVTTRIELTSDSTSSRIWLPLPSVDEAEWMRPMGNEWTGNFHTVKQLSDGIYGAQMLYAEWEASESAPMIEVVSRFATRDRATDWSARSENTLSGDTRRLYTKSTALIPTDGIVLDTAMAASGNARSDVDRARLIYDWVVDNSFRDPKTRGCGLGDIGTMLETGNLSGKCADINTLFVGMCRAVGIPARDVYGVRVADSRFGYKTLGKSGDISKAQHCRAEVFLEDYGWIPVDPADVRKVVLDEEPGLTLSHPLVTRVRDQLFGAWETNWLAYNFAHDIALPNSNGPEIPFMMYPHGETANGRLDSLDPANFRYALTATEISS